MGCNGSYHKIHPELVHDPKVSNKSSSSSSSVGLAGTVTTTEPQAPKEPYKEHKLQPLVLPTAPHNVEFYLGKGGRQWGLTLDVFSIGCQVAAVAEESAVSRWNQFVLENRKLKVGDLITKMDGNARPEGIAGILNGEKKYHRFSALRPLEETVKIKRKSAETAWGIVWDRPMMGHDGVRTCLMIKQDVQIQKESLKANSFVKKVNQVEGSSQALEAELERATEVDLVVLRMPAMPPYEPGQFD